MRGHVVYAKFSTPINNAHIIYSRGNFSKETTSGDGGKFSVGSLDQWHYFIYIGSPGMYPFPDRYALLLIPAMVSVKAKGYTPKNISIYTGGGEIEDGKLKEPKTDFRFDEDIVVRLNKK
ncbi:MAG: hypothetical protein GY750_04450 [Lentisphaerae bacterium]|nr:hypothetical protein [Lentisphaerota bacterium]MCP4100662.1 hypothetical protein [Lentisphaerota bacterium]